MEYRKKPLIVTAEQYTGGNCRDILRFAGSHHWNNIELHDTDHPVVATCDGDSEVLPGDYVVKTVDGTLHVMSEFSFSGIYEPVED